MLTIMMQSVPEGEQSQIISAGWLQLHLELGFWNILAKDVPANFTDLVVEPEHSHRSAL